ncbi:MAG: alkaline phosphatase family protein [Firmicutes bacterium]|nr:alkaline phosphatase family protein [Bacillota bacterium]
MKNRKFGAVFSLLLMAALFLYLPVQAGEKQGEKKHFVKAILITEDACNAELTDSLAAAGKLPYLAAFRKKAAKAEYVTAHFPTKTGPGHASLYCGCYGDVHGITCNEVNKGKDHTILELTNGFISSSLTAEPLWTASSRQGMKTLLINAAQSAPVEKYLKDAPEGSLIIVNGFGGHKSGFEIIDQNKVQHSKTVWKNIPVCENVVSDEIKAGDTNLYIAVLDTTRNGKKDFSQIKIGTTADFKDKDTVTLKPSVKGFSGVIPVKFGNDYAGVHFSLISLDKKGEKFKILKSCIMAETINGKPVDEEYVRKTGGFCGNGASGMYSKGEFGKTIPQGGDGTAEKIYLETAELVNRQLGAKAKYCAAKYNPDLIVGYTPYPDETLHMWFGYADYEKTGFDPAKGKLMRHYLEQSFIFADAYFGDVLSIASDNTYFALASDHGMDSCYKMFYPNTILKNAGLIATDDKGKIDLSKTKIIYGMQNGAFLMVNSTDYKGGIVTPEQKDEVIKQAVDALSKARDPITGESIVTGFYYPSVDETRWGIGGPKGGDVYLDLLYGYYFSSAMKDEYASPCEPIGAHIFIPSRKNMHSMFYFSGPGIKAKTFKPCRIIDIMPTLFNYLKITPPADCKGKTVEF